MIKIIIKTMLAGTSAAVGLLFCSGEGRLVAQENIVRNGSFEGGWQNGPIGWGWTYNVGLYGETTGAADGRYWADAFGTLYQDLTTIPGGNYHLRFALAGNFNISAPTAAKVLWNGTEIGTANWSPFGHNINNIGWVWEDYDVTAQGSSTRLTFENPFVGDGSGRILRLDGVSVVPVPVPEPAGVCLIAIGAAVIALSRRHLLKRPNFFCGECARRIPVSIRNL